MKFASHERRGARQVLFFAGALLVPVVLLALIELGLRAVGFGGSYPLFVDFEGIPGARIANQSEERT